MSGDISLGEVIRQLESISKRQEEMLREIRDDRKIYAETYLRRDLYEAQSKAAADDVRDINARLDKSEAFRKQILSGLAVNIVMLFLTAAIALSNFMARGGA